MISDKKKNSSKSKQIWGIVLSFLLAAVFLYIAFRGVRARDVLSTMINTGSLLWVAVLFLSLTFSHFIRALRWKVMLKSVKPNASITNLFGSMMVGYGVNSVIPRLGEVSRAILLGNWEGISRTSIIGTVIVERVIDSIALAASTLIAVLIYDGDLYKEFTWLKSTLYIVSLMLIGIIFFIVLIIRFKAKFYNAIINVVSKISPKIAHKLAHIFEMLIVGFSSIKGTKSYLLTFILTILIQITYAVNSYVGFYTLNMQLIKPITFAMAWILMCISSWGVVIPTPGGMGSYHTITKTAIVLLWGFSAEISLAYAVLNYFVSLVLFIGSAMLFFFWLNHRYIKKTGKSEGLMDILETNMDSL